MRNKRTKYYSIAFSAIAAIAGIITVLSYFHIRPFNEKEVTVETVVYKLLNLTNKSDSVSVYYKGKSVNNLWRIRLTIKNSGEKRIIGIGESDLVNDKLNFILDKEYHILSYDMIQNDFLDSLSIKGHQVYCYFRKWNSTEKLQLDILVQSDYKLTAPSLILDERNVINSVVKSKKYDITEIGSNDADFEWLTNLKIKYPHFVFIAAKWMLYYFGTILMLVPIVFIFRNVRTNLNYRKWKRKNWRIFLKELDGTELTSEYKELYKRKPYKVPNEYKHKFSSIPQEPDGFWFSLFMFLFGIILAFGGLIMFLVAFYNM